MTKRHDERSKEGSKVSEIVLPNFRQNSLTPQKTPIQALRCFLDVFFETELTLHFLSF